MPMIWRTLSVIQTLVDFHDLDLGIPELAQTYNLRCHGSHYFLFQIKPHRSHLVLRATQNDPKWKGRFFFVARSSLPDGDSTSSIWVKKANFAELAPPNLETEANLRRFLEIPESERTFKHPHQVESVGSQESEATMSAHFSLSDIDAETPIVKKVAPESSKARIPNLRSKSAKKRKNDDVIDLSDPSADIIKAAEQIAKCYQEKLEMIDDMRKLADVRIAAHEKDAAELAKVKKELKDTKSSITKKFAEADSKVMDMKRTLMSEMKRDAAIAVLEARILMASEIAAKGVDTSLWTVAAWKTRLAKLKGQDPDVMTSLEDTADKPPSSDKAPKQASKPTSNKAPKATAEKAAEVGNPDDVVMAEQDPVAEAVKDLAAMAAGGDTLGEEGI